MQPPHIATLAVANIIGTYTIHAKPGRGIVYNNDNFYKTNENIKTNIYSVYLSRETMPFQNIASLFNHDFHLKKIMSRYLLNIIYNNYIENVVYYIIMSEYGSKSFGELSFTF